MNEQISDNGFLGQRDETGTGLTPTLSVCIPTWKDNATPLLTSLAKLTGDLNCEVLIYDDGSADPDMTVNIMQSLASINAPARLITATQNHGRSHARNRLITHARSEWLLLLDADMLPDHESFLSQYLNAITEDPMPGLVAGGFSLEQVTPTPKQRLHAAQSQTSECLSAAERAHQPGLHVFTSNILVHRAVLEQVKFDEAYTGWGWEDVDWGLRVAAAFPVRHIDNTATHLGLDETASLMRKYAGSGENFARLALTHPEDVSSMTLYKVSKKLKAVPARGLLRDLAGALASDRLSFMPMKLRLFGLKLFRAATYAETLK